MSDCHAIPLPPCGWTPEAMARFLDHLSVKGNVRAACARVGLSAEAAYRLRRRDALFARGWAAALVLAHLARLDRLVEEDDRALEDAGRFDEVLARIAGERFPEELAGDDEALPMERAEVVGEAVADAQDRLLYAEGEPERQDWSGEEDHAGAEEAHDAREEALLAAGAAAGVAAQAQWDGWVARACAVVDGLVDAAPPPASPEPSPTPPSPPPASDVSRAIAAVGREVIGPGEGGGVFHSGVISKQVDSLADSEITENRHPRTVSTVSTSALAHALSDPARGPMHGLLAESHPASPARKQAGRRGRG